MNPATGEVVRLDEKFEREHPERAAQIRRDWVQLTPGEIVEVKGIRFRVHDVGDQRLVLKFDKK